MKFEDLSEKQKVYICNGCGGKGGKIIPPYAIMFQSDCDHHDYGYWKGGNIWDRLKSDWKLFTNMLKDSNYGLKIWKTLYFIGWAVCYFVGVRLAGFTFFHYGDTRVVENYDWEKIYEHEGPNNVIKWENYEKISNTIDA